MSQRFLLRGPSLAAAAAAALLVIIGIGLPLVGTRVFVGADLMLPNDPYRSHFDAGTTPSNICLGDTVDYAAHMTDFERRFRDGDFPEWLPLTIGGTPLGTTPSLAIASPLSLPYHVMPIWLAPAYVKLLEMIASIVGMMFFLRRLHLSRAAALTGGLLFTSSGFMVMWTNWQQTRVAAFIPWLFWAVERFLGERRSTAAAPIAVVMACLIFGGFPSVTGYALYALAPYVALRLIASGKLRGIGGIVRDGTAVVVAIGLGIALTAFQLLPFAHQYAGFDTNRNFGASQILSVRMLSTLAFPTAFGSCAGNHGYYGPVNEIEQNVFFGAAALVLAGIGILRRPSPRTPKGVLSYFVVGAIACFVLIWRGGHALELVDHLPVFSNNPIGRLRSILGFFLAVLAAFGVDAVVRGVGPGTRRRLAVEVGALGAGTALLLWVARWVADQTRAYTLLNPSRLVFPIVSAGLALGAIVVATMLARRRAPSRAAWLRTALIALLPILCLVESLIFVLPFWPRIPRDKFYPKTDTTTFLAEHEGHERTLATGKTIGPSRNVAYDINAPNGHAFIAPEWRDLLQRVDPLVMQSPTYSAFHVPLRLDQVESPILDRLGVRYLVTSFNEPVYGTPEQIGPPGARVEFGSNRPLESPVFSGPIRAVAVDVASGFVPTDKWARIEVQIVDADGKTVKRGAVRIFSHLQPGRRFEVPVLGEDIGADQPVRARVTFESTDGNDVAIVMPQLVLVRPADDGLRLVDATDAIVYQRLSALPRIRWASRTRVIADSAQRIEALATDGSMRDTVVLDEPGAPGAGQPAALTIERDFGDSMDVRVDAPGSGYLVIADSLGPGWYAEVDGKRAPLVKADHAFVAVALPEGGHTVHIAYAPPGRRLGFLVTAVALLVPCAAGIWVLVRRRSRRTENAASAARRAATMTDARKEAASAPR